MDVVWPPIPRSALEKDPRPGPLFEGNPVGKAQHEGALPPPCIVRKDPRVARLWTLRGRGYVRMRVQSLGREDPLEKGMATHSSILAKRTP